MEKRSGKQVRGRSRMAISDSRNSIWRIHMEMWKKGDTSIGNSHRSISSGDTVLLILSNIEFSSSAVMIAGVVCVAGHLAACPKVQKMPRDEAFEMIVCREVLVQHQSNYSGQPVEGSRY